MYPDEEEREVRNQTGFTISLITVLKHPSGKAQLPDREGSLLLVPAKFSLTTMSKHHLLSRQEQPSERVLGDTKCVIFVLKSIFRSLIFKFSCILTKKGMLTHQNSND